MKRGLLFLILAFVAFLEMKALCALESKIVAAYEPGRSQCS
jgi:hypothetical protein